mgnify:FL=1
MKDYPFNPNKCFKTNHGMGDNNLHHRTILACPICSFDYNYISKPIFEDGADNYKSSAPAYRGHLVRIPFVCENGHNWEICFGFHKGNTFVFFRDPREKDAQ